MDIVIRPIEPQDTGSVLALYRAAIHAVPDEVYGPVLKRLWAERSEAEFDRQNALRQRFVATDGDAIIGYTGFDRNRATVTECYTLPVYQGVGIGSLLIWHVLGVARTQNVSRLSVLASRNAMPFYQKLGFLVEHAEDLPMADGNRLPCFRMGVDV